MKSMCLPQQKPKINSGSHRSVLLTYMLTTSVLVFVLLALSCSQKLNSVECNHEICDTIDSHRIIFNLDRSDSLYVNQDDTVKIDDKVNTIRLEGWHCQTCKGIEVVRLQNRDGQLIDSLFVSHHGNYFESNYWKLDNIQKGIIYKIIWVNGVDFYLLRE